MAKDKKEKPVLNLDGEKYFIDDMTDSQKELAFKVALDQDHVGDIQNKLRTNAFIRQQLVECEKVFVEKFQKGHAELKKVLEPEAEVLEARYKQGGSNYDDDKDEIIKDEFDDSKVWNGLVAQEVKAVMDDIGVEFSGWSEDTKGKQGIQYSTLVVPLIKAVQELTAKVEALENA